MCILLDSITLIEVIKIKSIRTQIMISTNSEHIEPQQQQPQQLYNPQKKRSLSFPINLISF